MAPTSESSSGTCRRCGVYSNFRVQFVDSQWGWENSATKSHHIPPPEDGDERVLLCTCDHCGNYMVTVEAYIGVDGGSDGMTIEPRWLVSGYLAECEGAGAHVYSTNDW